MYTRSVCIAATCALVLFICSTPSTAQNVTLPDEVKGMFNSLVGSWEGDILITTPAGGTMSFPMTMEYQYILDNNTTLEGRGTLTVGGGTVLKALDIFSWDAQLKKVVEISISPSGEVYYCEGELLKTDGVFKTTTNKTKEQGTELAISVLSLPDDRTMVWDIDVQFNGKPAATQKATLHKK